MVTGGILLLAGAVLYITKWSLAPYLYCIGAAMFAAAQIADRYDGDNKTIKRLRAQQVTGSVFLLLAGLLMFSAPLHARVLLAQGMNDNLRMTLLSITRPNSWILMLAMAAVFELYPALRMDHVREDE